MTIRHIHKRTTAYAAFFVLVLALATDHLAIADDASRLAKAQQLFTLMHMDRTYGQLMTQVEAQTEQFTKQMLPEDAITDEQHEKNVQPVYVFFSTSPRMQYSINIISKLKSKFFFSPKLQLNVSTISSLNIAIGERDYVLHFVDDRRMKECLKLLASSHKFGKPELYVEGIAKILLVSYSKTPRVFRLRMNLISKLCSGNAKFKHKKFPILFFS